MEDREVRVFGDGAFVPSRFVGLKGGVECAILPPRRVPGGKRARLEQLVKRCSEDGLTLGEMESILIEGIGILAPDTTAVPLRDLYAVDDLLEMFAHVVSAYNPPASEVPGEPGPTRASGRSSGTG